MTRTLFDMEIPGKRPRGRPRIRWMDNIRRDMRLHGLDDRIQEGVVNDGGKGRPTIGYKTQGENNITPVTRATHHV